MLTGLNNKRFVQHLESYTVSTCVSIKACKNILKMPLREERVVLQAQKQATMFNVTEDVSFCTDKCIMIASSRSPLFFVRCGANFLCVNSSKI